MKFGDKLIELRKKKGYSQEELAEKLGVSRQSVSKWESNNTYPETDKIIQIANLFECSMDDLINDKVTDVESSLRKNKNIYNIWNSLLEFITKTINMFSKMTFQQGLKCIIEMIIISIIMLIIGKIICGISCDLIVKIFSFVGNDFPRFTITFRTILEGIFGFIWFIISLIVLIYSFKIRYLNDYEQETININEQKQNKETTIEQKNDNKIIRNENEKPYAFLTTLSNIVIIFIKFIATMILIGICSVTIGFVITTVVMLAFIPTNLVFLWMAFIFGAASAISILAIIIIICFIFNKKMSVKAPLITFISSIVVFGTGIGMGIVSIENIDFIDDNSAFNLQVNNIEIEYKDNLVIEDNGVGTNTSYKYIIDNSLSDNQIIVSKEVDNNFFTLDTVESEMDKLPVISVVENSKDIKVLFEFFIKNLKDNKVYTFNEYGTDPLVIKANETTINNLINNLKKLYLVEEENNGNEIIINVQNSKVHFKNGLRGEYNGLDDTIEYYEDDYSCKKEIEATPYGERFIYICNEKED